ncbi:MAG: alkaline phosphatase, partial [Caulobacteraceae bacterium]
MNQPTLPSRRSVLTGFGGAGLVVGGAVACVAAPRFEDTPFTLGVAAGDPALDGFVIWTRLAIDPMQPGSGLPAAAIPVSWEVATDLGFRDIVRRGDDVADPDMGHSVHVEVAGLRPSRPYFYRFTSGGARSMTGRAKTAPAADQPLSRVRLALAGCQRYSDGFYTAHRQLAQEDLDFVFLYGDYIYEGATAADKPGETDARVGQAIGRVHVGGICQSLEDYRRRYSQYTLDPDLQASRAANAWFATYDDHEVSNNWTGQSVRYETARALDRREAAMQAWYEFMPVRRSVLP